MWIKIILFMLLTAINCARKCFQTHKYDDISTSEFKIHRSFQNLKQWQNDVKTLRLHSDDKDILELFWKTECLLFYPQIRTIFRTMATITFQFKETKSSMQLTKTDDTKQESLKNVCFNLRKHLGQQM